MKQESKHEVYITFMNHCYERRKEREKKTKAMHGKVHGGCRRIIGIVVSCFHLQRGK